MFRTSIVNEVIHYALLSEDLSNIIVLKEDNHGHRIIKLEGTTFDALEMCLLESIM